jgi:glycosyltransferase involved in cell wall biosynthesis
MPWPRISIITPSYNQGQFVERTVRSVLLQRYPNLEYILMDGGSTDDTLDRIAPYMKDFSYSVSQPDGGQADAIANGFARSSGEIMAYLNSDDMLAPDTLHFVARYFRDNPNIDWIYSHRCTVDDDDRIIWYWILPPHNDFLMRRWDYIPQETCFWRRKLFEKTGNIDRSYKFAMDYDLFARFMNQGRGRRLNRFLGVFRDHGASKTKQLLETVGATEMLRVRRKFRIRAAITDGFFGLLIGNWVKYAGRYFAAAAHTLPGGFGGIGYDYNEVWGGLLRPEGMDAVQSRWNGSSEEENSCMPLCPITQGLADRLLFNLPCARNGCSEVSQVYLNTKSRVAIISPFLKSADANKLKAHPVGNQPAFELSADGGEANRPFPARRLGAEFLEQLGHLPFFPNKMKVDWSNPSADLILEVTRGIVPVEKGIRFLGIGSASRSPDYLKVLKARTSWNMISLETISAAMAEPVFRPHDIVETPLEENVSIQEILKGLDLIFLGDGIQSCANPRGYLRKAAVLLNLGGLLILRTPNLDSEQRHLFGSAWTHWKPGVHRFVFGRKSVRQLLEQTGFSVARIVTVSDPASTAISAQRLMIPSGSDVKNDPPKIRETNADGVVRACHLFWDRLGKGDEIFALARRLS